jgi:hypothetical protein
MRAGVVQPLQQVPPYRRRTIALHGSVSFQVGARHAIDDACRGLPDLARRASAARAAWTASTTPR